MFSLVAIIYWCIGCFLCGFCITWCGAKLEDEEAETAANTAANAAANTPQTLITNQPTTMPTPNATVGWTMPRPQDQPYPELNSNCPYPPVLPYPPQSPANMPSVSNAQAPYPPSTSSGPSAPSAPYPAQDDIDSPPNYDVAMTLLKK
ncbi:formin-1-like isoform X1 [Chironomus tepperi]|uniref:formin-1-like isoform X1 n=1 Tax=Chironomus tepperi TaxID=113505 RepID=UPI00391F859A